MGKLEETILSSPPLKPAYYRHFIDDIFMIWQHSEKDLQDFITNKANHSIQFTHEKSQTDKVFLNVVAYKIATSHNEENEVTLNVEPT